MGSTELAKPAQMIEQLLVGMGKFGASDLHVQVGYVPIYRVQGVLRKLDLPVFPNSKYVSEMMLPLVPEGPPWMSE